MKAAGTVLEKILARTSADLPARRNQRPLPVLRALARAAPKAVPFEQTMRRAPAARIVAELKRKSPWQGFIDRDLDVAQAAKEFASGGAAALGIVTEGPHFGGSPGDLVRARQGCKLPLLRKDFIIDEYQLVESRVHGASAVLLIVAALEPARLREFLLLARDLSLEALLEVHDEADLELALDLGCAMVAIDNRDLRTSEVDLSVTERLAPIAARSGVLIVTQGGIRTPEDIRRLARAGADVFLVGESLLAAADRAAAARVFVEAARG